MDLNNLVFCEIVSYRAGCFMFSAPIVANCKLWLRYLQSEPAAGSDWPGPAGLPTTASPQSPPPARLSQPRILKTLAGSGVTSTPSIHCILFVRLSLWMSFFANESLSNFANYGLCSSLESIIFILSILKS